MTVQEKKKVQQWLFSIKKSEQAIASINSAIELLDEDKDTPNYETRRSFLLFHKAMMRLNCNYYYRTLEAMRATEPSWGELGAKIIDYKYYQNGHVDEYRRWMNQVPGCDYSTFYRIQRKALQFFYDVLPHIFRLDEQEYKDRAAL